MTFEELVNDTKGLIIRQCDSEELVSEYIHGFMSMAGASFSEGDLESAGIFTRLTAAWMRVKKELFG